MRTGGGKEDFGELTFSVACSFCCFRFDISGYRLADVLDRIPEATDNDFLTFDVSRASSSFPSRAFLSSRALSPN